MKDVIVFLNKNIDDLELIEVYCDSGSQPVMVLKFTSSVWDKGIYWAEWPKSLVMIKTALINLAKQIPALIKRK